MLKIRRSRDRLIFNMGIPIPGKDDLYIETGPWTNTWHYDHKEHYLPDVYKNVDVPSEHVLSLSSVILAVP